MPQLVISELAERDLHRIALYSADRWGSRQAESYISALHETVRQIATGRALFKPIDVQSARFERVLSGRHYVYVQRQNEYLFLSRILHSAMDVRLHLLPKLPSHLL